jgi:hypothetical protein
MSNLGCLACDFLRLLNLFEAKELGGLSQAAAAMRDALWRFNGIENAAGPCGG